MCDAYYMVGVSHWYRHIKTSIPHRETPWSLTSDHGVSLCGILVLFLIILSIPPSKFPQFCFDINQRKHTSPFGNKKISSFQPCLVVKSMLLWSKEQGMHQSVTFVKILIRMNVRIYSYQQNYTNEYPNIFILFLDALASLAFKLQVSE